MRSVNEIESKIGPGPYTLRHVRDISRGHAPGVCALCGSRLGTTFVFFTGSDRQVEIGSECSNAIPGARRVATEIKRAKKAGRPLPYLPLEPGVHMTDYGCLWTCVTEQGDEFSVLWAPNDGFQITRLSTQETTRVQPRKTLKTIADIEGWLQQWLKSL